MPLLPGGRSAAYVKVTGQLRRHHAHTTVAAATPNAVAPSIPLRDCYLPRSFVCGGRGVAARGRLRFFGRGFFQFQVSRRGVSVRLSFAFAFAFAFVCFSFLFVCVARAHGCGGCLRVAVARMRALAAAFSCVVLAVWQACDRAWRLLSSWLSPALMWSTSVACMSHAGWCHRWCAPTACALVGGGVATGSRPAHLCFAFARTCFLILFQFVGKRWRRLDVVHGMCAGYLVGCGWWGGWRVVGVLALVFGFWLGLVSGVGVSGGWRCLVGGSWFLVGGWCGVWGAVPLRPLLNSLPHPLGGLWFLVRVVPLLGGGVCWLAAVCGLRFFSVGVGWACGWFVLRVVFWLGCSQPGVVVAVFVGCLGSAACLLGVVSWLLASRVVSCVGGLFSSLLCCSRWVGRPGRSGSSSPPSFSPHSTRWRLPDPRIRWAISHVKTLTD